MTEGTRSTQADFSLKKFSNQIEKLQRQYPSAIYTNAATIRQDFIENDYFSVLKETIEFRLFLK